MTQTKNMHAEDMRKEYITLDLKKETDDFSTSDTLPNL